MKCRITLVMPEYPKLAIPAMVGLAALLAPLAFYADGPIGSVLAAAGGGSFALGSWLASSHKRSLAKASSAAESWKCTRTELRPPKPVHVKAGILEVVAYLSRGSFGIPRLKTKFIEAKDLGAIEALKPIKLKDYGGIAGFHWTLTWTEPSRPSVFPVEWLKLPAYSLEEPGFKGRLHKILVIPLQPTQYSLAPSRLELRASWNGARARAEVEGGHGSISGYLELEGGRQGRARLYLELHKPPIKYWVLLARVEGSGIERFTWSTQPSSIVYGVLPLVRGGKVWPRSVAKASCSPQLLIGSAAKWIDNARLRLAITTPQASLQRTRPTSR